MQRAAVVRSGQALAVFAAMSWVSEAGAAVPAGYTGTPYQGVAQSIPGRVELANLDEGGLNVAFFADHRRDNAVAEGYSPVSGDDHRPGNLALPNICKTNRAVEVPGQGSEDFWEDGSRYPSEANLYEYYMGFSHTVDWVRVTVNVKYAGTYNISSNWACESAECGLSVWFNDGTTPTDNPDRPLDGENKTGEVKFEGTKDYHKWRAYPNFAQVQLNAGEQLMTFHVEVANHLQYGHLVFELVGGEPGGTGGAGGAGGTGAGGAGGVATTGGTGTAGASTTAGTSVGGAAPGSGGGGATGGTPSAPLGGTGTGGAPAQTGGTSSAAPSSPTTADAGGCSLAPARSGAGSIASLLLASLALLAYRRRS